MTRKSYTLHERKILLCNRLEKEIVRMEKTRMRYPKGSEAYKHYTWQINNNRATVALLNDIFSGDKES